MGFERGSDASAAGGRYSELSEWQRSVSDAGIPAKERTGHRNRAAPLPSSANKCPVDTCLARGRIHRQQSAVRKDCEMLPIFC